MILGITGAFGAGKSTVREEFTAAGWCFFDADSVCHGIYSFPGVELASRIIAIGGKDTIAPDGSVDRKVLAAKVFGNAEKLRELTGLIYPELERKLDEMIRDCRENNRDGAFEIPLLFENNYRNRFDAVLTVWSSEDVRHGRLKKYRGFSGEEIRKREECQMSADRKLELADFALINNGSREILRRQIIELSDKVRKWNEK